MERSILARKGAIIDRKIVDEAHRSFYEFRINARKEDLRLRGYDVEKVLKMEKEVLSGLRNQTKSMMEQCLEISKANAEMLAKMKSQTVDFTCGSTRPQQERKPTIEEGRALGLVTHWSNLTTLTDCTNGRVLPPEINPPDPENTSHGTYTAACTAEATADTLGSGEDGITHSCSIIMKHDFTFIPLDAKKYRFTPDFFINGIVGMSGAAMGFSTTARVTMWLEESGVLKSIKKNVFLKSDEEIHVDAFATSFYFNEPPSAVMSLGELEETTITVACELYVEAKGLATAMLNLSGVGQYSTPWLRVDYAKRTVSLHARPEDEDAVPFDPEIREGVIPFTFETPLFGR